MDTTSAWPSDKIDSAISGVLIRLVVITGIDTSLLIFSLIHVNALRGTDVTIVGILASCQPIPVLSNVTPASSNIFASATTSSNVLPLSTKSSMDNLKIMIKSLPTCSLIALTISIAIRVLFSKLPPYWSVRLLVLGAINWLIK